MKRDLAEYYPHFLQQIKQAATSADCNVLRNLLADERRQLVENEKLNSAILDVLNIYLSWQRDQKLRAESKVFLGERLAALKEAKANNSGNFASLAAEYKTLITTTPQNESTRKKKLAEEVKNLLRLELKKLLPEQRHIFLRIKILVHLVYLNVQLEDNEIQVGDHLDLGRNIFDIYCEMLQIAVEVPDAERSKSLVRHVRNTPGNNPLDNELELLQVEFTRGFSLCLAKCDPENEKVEAARFRLFLERPSFIDKRCNADEVVGNLRERYLLAKLVTDSVISYQTYYALALENGLETAEVFQPLNAEAEHYIREFKYLEQDFLLSYNDLLRCKLVGKIDNWEVVHNEMDQLKTVILASVSYCRFMVINSIQFDNLGHPTFGASEIYANLSRRNQHYNSESYRDALVVLAFRDFTHNIEQCRTVAPGNIKVIEEAISKFKLIFYNLKQNYPAEERNNFTVLCNSYMSMLLCLYDLKPQAEKIFEPIADVDTVGLAKYFQSIAKYYLEIAVKTVDLGSIVIQGQELINNYCDRKIPTGSSSYIMIVIQFFFVMLARYQGREDAKRVVNNLCVMTLIKFPEACLNIYEENTREIPRIDLKVVEEQKEVAAAPQQTKRKKKHKKKVKDGKSHTTDKSTEPKAEEPKAAEPEAEEPKAEVPEAAEPKAEVAKAEVPETAEPKAEELRAEVSKPEESTDTHNPKDPQGFYNTRGFEAALKHFQRKLPRSKTADDQASVSRDISHCYHLHHRQIQSPESLIAFRTETENMLRFILKNWHEIQNPEEYFSHAKLIAEELGIVLLGENYELSIPDANAAKLIEFFMGITEDDGKYQPYIFGGLVRDHYFNRTHETELPIGDVDIALDASIAEIIAILENKKQELDFSFEPVGKDPIYYVKLTFADGHTLDIVSLREMRAGPRILAQFLFATNNNFSINQLLYSPCEKRLYDFTEGRAALSTRRFYLVDEFNRRYIADEPKNLFLAMYYIAKTRRVGKPLELIDKEEFQKRVAHLADLAEPERKQIHNAFLKLYCSKVALEAFLTCKDYGCFPVLFPQFLSLMDERDGYLMKCFENADAVLTEIPAAQDLDFFHKTSFMLAMVCWHPNFNKDNRELGHFITQCLFWCHGITQRQISEIHALEPSVGIFKAARQWLLDQVKAQPEKQAKQSSSEMFSLK